MRPTKPRRPKPGGPRAGTHVGKCPTGKARYPAFGPAVAAAVRVSSKVGPLRCYRCPHCKGWHLTRLPEWKDPT